MSAYVDGFVLPVPKKNLPAYMKMAKAASRVWKKYGALEYRECVGDDLKVKWGVPFTRISKAKSGETVFFSWIIYRNKAHRDSVNKKIMKDPELAAMMNGKKMPFDMKKMAYGGFKIAVEA